MGFWRGRFRVTSGMAFEQEGHILVSDFYNNRVQIFKTEGTYVDQFGEEGKEPGQFDGSTGLASSETGDFYVTDFHNHRIQRFRC